MSFASEQERVRALLRQGALGNVCFPAGQSLRQRFDTICRTYPDRVAIEAGDRGVTYAEAHERVRKAAEGLRSALATAPAGVGVLGPISPDAVLAQLAVLYAGHYYHYLDPALEPDALRDRAKAARLACAVVTRAEVPGGVDLPCVEWDALAAGRAPATAPTAPAAATSGALFRTSGSSGSAKWVLFPVDGLLQDIARQTHTLSISAGDRVDLLFSLSFSASLASIYDALLNGGTLVLGDLGTLGAGRLWDWLGEERITLSTMTQSTLRAMLATAGPRRPEHLRLVSCGGEALFQADAAAFFRRAPTGCVLQNAYALTETRTVTEFLLRAETPLPHGIAGIGWPVEGKRVTLEPREGDPEGTGEICVRSRHIAESYFRAPEPGAFRSEPGTGEVLFCTGDLGRMDSDGCLHWLGRRDDLVKVRGFRISLAEVEQRAAAVAGVREARAEQVEGELCLYLAHAGRGGDSLPRAVREQLPPRLRPARVMVLPELPRTHTGKVDRPALRGLTGNGAATPRGPAPDAPRERELERVVAVLGRCMGRPVPSVDADLWLDLGLDSLAAARIARELERTFGRDLAPDTLHRYRTAREVAGLLRQPGGSAAGTACLVPLQPLGHRPPFFCVHALDGHVLYYHSLSRVLGADQPVYGLQAPGTTGRGPFHTRVEEIAACYVEEIRRLYPTGPYQLGGLSFGGIVAWEMAQQLARTGEPARLVVLLDTYGPGYPRYQPVGRRVRCHLERMAGPHRTSLPAYLRPRLEALRHNAARKLFLRTGGRVGSAGRVVAAEAAHLGAVRAYQVRPYSGRVALFRAEEQPVGSVPEPLLGWDGLAPHLELHRVPGSHGSIIHPPHLDVLAAELRRCLESG